VLIVLLGNLVIFQAHNLKDGGSNHSLTTNFVKQTKLNN
jgi:hypothetical protein